MITDKSLSIVIVSIFIHRYLVMITKSIIFIIIIITKIMTIIIISLIIHNLVLKIINNINIKVFMQNVAMSDFKEQLTTNTQSQSQIILIIP